MNDKLPARICTVPPFDDADKAVSGGCLLVMLALFALASFCRGQTTKESKSAGVAKPRVVTACSGCGSEWSSPSGKPIKPITKCPNCPMSEEEWERLKEEVRKQLEEKE